MPVRNHNHDWASTPNGYACQTCTAAISDAQLISSAPGSTTNYELNDLIDAVSITVNGN